MRDHAIPVDVALFRKDEDQGMTVVGQIGAPMRSFGTDVGFVGLIEGGDGAVGSLSVLVGRFIVEKCHFEAGLTRGLLEECKIVIGERSTLAIPIDNKSGDAHVACLLDLLAQDCRIVADISHIHVLPVSEPWHVDGKKFWPGMRGLRILLRHTMDTGCGAPSSNRETHDRQRQ